MELREAREILERIERSTHWSGTTDRPRSVKNAAYQQRILAEYVLRAITRLWWSFVPCPVAG